jgi:hypothetical protein
VRGGCFVVVKKMRKGGKLIEIYWIHQVKKEGTSVVLLSLFKDRLAD